MCIVVDGPAGHLSRETSSPAQYAGHSVRQALFVKLRSRTNSLSSDMWLEFKKHFACVVEDYCLEHTYTRHSIKCVKTNNDCSLLLFILTQPLF